MLHLDYRDYSPTLGRPVQMDPLGLGAGDNNWYRFVGDNPTNGGDPSGLWIAHPVGKPGFSTLLECFGDDNLELDYRELWIGVRVKEGAKKRLDAYVKRTGGSAEYAKFLWEAVTSSECQGALAQIQERYAKQLKDQKTLQVSSSGIYAPSAVVGKNSKGNTVIQLPNRQSGSLSEVTPSGQLVQPISVVFEVLLQSYFHALLAAA